MMNSLCDVEVSATAYFDALAPVLSSDHRQATIDAQLLLARLLSPAFHCFDIVGLAQVQTERRRLEWAFAESVLWVVGIFAVRRFALKILPLFIESFDLRGRPLVDAVVPSFGISPRTLSSSSAPSSSVSASEVGSTATSST
jgi:hypothetical protein